MPTEKGEMGFGSQHRVLKLGFESFTNKESRVWFSEQFKQKETSCTPLAFPEFLCIIDGYSLIVALI